MSADYAFFLGDIAMDEYYRAPHWPRHGTKVWVRAAGSHPGGMIANAAAVYAGYGERALFCWAMNNSATTDVLLADLASRGVDPAHVIRDDRLGDSRCLIVLAEGDHTVLTPETGLSRISLTDDALDTLRGATYLYTAIGDVRMVSHRGLDAGHVLDQARETGCRFVLDLDVADLRPGDDGLLRRVDIMFVNAIGFTRLSRGRPEAEVIAEQLGAGTGAIVVTRGSDGCHVYTADGRLAVPGLAVDVVDVTGAGDTFGASYVHALGRTGDHQLAAVFATAAAARAVRTVGARSGITSDDEVIAFIAEHGLLRTHQLDALATALATAATDAQTTRTLSPPGGPL